MLAASAIRGVPAIHRRPLLGRDHLEAKLVVVAQERAPLPPARDGRRVGDHLDDRRWPLLAQGVVEPGHDREVEAHLALAPRWCRSSRPPRSGLVRLGQQYPAGVLLVDHGRRSARNPRPAEVLAVGPLLLEEVGDRVEPEPVDAEVHPEPDDIEHLRSDPRVLEVEVRLVREEPVPEELPPDRVEGPVRHLGVDEDDPRLAVGRVGVGPHVVVAERAVRLGRWPNWNHGCWSLVWFMTRSVTMRMPRARLRHQFDEPGSVPNSGSTAL